MSKVEAEHDFFSFAFRCRHPSDDDGSREAAARIIFGETKALCHHGEITCASIALTQFWTPCSNK